MRRVAKIVSLWLLLSGCSLIDHWNSFRVGATEFNVLKAGTSCNLPCWNSITPGETTLEEAIRLIETQFNNEHRLETGAGAIYCFDDRCDQSVSLQVDPDTSSISTILFSYPPDAYSCHSFYEQYGEPDLFFDWYLEDASSMLYNEYHVEVITVLLDNSHERWVNYIWVRDESSYLERTQALTMPPSSQGEYDVGEPLQFLRAFDVATYCT